MSEIVPFDVNGGVIHQREADGYFHATGMCKSAGKNWANYWRNDATQQFLEELSSDMRISISELIQTLKGGRPELQGTWVHPLVATNLAQWLSPKFAVAVTKLVTAWTEAHRRLGRPDIDEEDLLRQSAESMARAADRISQLKLAVISEREKATAAIQKKEEETDRALAAEDAIAILRRRLKQMSSASYRIMQEAEEEISSQTKNIFAQDQRDKLTLVQK